VIEDVDLAPNTRRKKNFEIPLQGAVGLREERKRLKVFYGAKGIDPFEGDLLYPHLVDMKVQKQRKRSYGAVDNKRQQIESSVL